MITFQHDITTNGDGFWSNEKGRVVEVVGLGIRALKYSDEDGWHKWGELRVFFNTESWDIDDLGLIYTDSGFKRELHKKLVENGITAEAVYSEQGMQGRNYVSMDVGEEFIKQFDRAFSTTTFYKNCD